MNKEFNPMDHTILLDDGTVYMPVAWRKAWFLNDHPNGQIDTNLEYMPEVEAFLATASVCLEDGGKVVTKDFGFRFLKKNGNPDQNAPMEAITQAIGRALSNIGYGTQFCSPDEGNGISVIADAPTKLSNGFAGNTGIPTTHDANSSVNANTEPTKGKRGRPRKEKASDDVVETNAIDTEFPNEVISTSTTVEETANTTVVAHATTAISDNEDMPTNAEEAKKVLIPFGQKKGQYMGEVLATDPSAVKWYAEKYTGNNEVVRTAAKLLMQ